MTLKVVVDRKLKGSLAEVRGYALRLLHYRSRSRKELLDRLEKKGFQKDHITQVMEFLEHANLINDELLALDLLRHSIERKHLGSMGIRMFLTKRGIPKRLIEKTMSEHNNETEEMSACKFIEKKKNVLSRYPDTVIKRRLWGMLQRRGYSSSVIIKAIQKTALLP